MAHFAVIGLGNFGGTLALELVNLGHEVVAVEANPEKAQTFRDRLPQVVVANGTDRHTLEVIGLNDVDCAIISLGRALEAAVLVALHCVELRVPKIYAKVVSSTHGRILKRLGVTRVIFPEREVARRLAHRITNPNLIDYLPITQGYSVEQIAAPLSMFGRTLEQVELPRRFGVHVIAIRESADPDSPLQIPTGGTIISEGDQLVLLARNEALARFETVE